MSNHFKACVKKISFDMIIEYMIGMESFTKKGFKHMMGES